MVKLAPAVFLDRDGVINEDSGYVDSPERVKLLFGASDGIKQLRDGGFKVVVITNQSGVSRGLFTEERLKEVNDRVIELLGKEGALIDAIYYCPHHPDDGCTCRKPLPGLIEKAASDMALDLQRSFMVGDSFADLEAGRVAGLEAVVLIDGPRYRSERREKFENSVLPDMVATDLRDAARWIVGERITPR